MRKVRGRGLKGKWGARESDPTEIAHARQSYCIRGKGRAGEESEEKAKEWKGGRGC